MAEYTLKHFGNLPIDNLEEYYKVDIEFNGNEIQIDLNFENKNIDLLSMDKVKNFIENIGVFDKQNESHIFNDYNDEDGDTVKFYLEDHLEEVDEDVLSNLINFNDKSTKPEKQLLNKLKLIRVGLYPHDKDIFAVFDYSIGKDITDYLIVINTDENGKLHYMTTES